MGIIKVLDEHVANQIAAGEVVERPASVVKELVENAIDAGSSRIDIYLEEGGLQTIRIADNGSGMVAEDLRLAFSRHATSKLSTGRDLFHIRSLGFRGEALPSIAAVSRLECVSSAGGDGLGWRIRIEGGQEQAYEEAASPRGTEFHIRELFYNTPARLKYMKTIQTELGHVSDAVYRLAMAHPNISFTLEHQGNRLLQTLGNGDLLQVIAAVYGTSTAKSMLQVQGENPDYVLSGFSSRPELTRAGRTGITTIVNGRHIRSYPLQQALLQAYHTLLPINRYPLAVLHLTMDPSLIDVNVHPSKQEVRFSKEPELMAFLRDAVREALAGTVLIPSQSKPAPRREQVIQEQLPLYRTGGAQPDAAEETTQRRPAEDAAGAGEVPGRQGSRPGAAADQAGTVDGPSLTSGSGPVKEPVDQASLPAAHKGRTASAEGAAPDMEAQPVPPAVRKAGSWEPERPSQAADMTVPLPEPPSAPPAYPPPSSGSRPAPPRPVATGPFKGSPQPKQTGGVPAFEQWSRLGAAAESQPGGKSRAAGTAELPELYPIGQLHGTYIVAQNPDGLFLIDQHAAHERINYERFYEKFGSPDQAIQELLIPITLEFTSAEAVVIGERAALLEQAGIRLEAFGGGTFLVRSCPYWFPKGEEQALLEEMTGWLLKEGKQLDIAKFREKAAIMCACKASIRANSSLSVKEMETVLDRLRQCRMPFTCPHGRPIVVSFSSYELEKMFKRVM